MIEGHGDDIYKYGDIRMNFSSNIYSHADLSGLYEHLKAHLHLISSYPEPQPYKLRNCLAAKHGVEPESVLVTNGATEAIYLIAQAFRNGVQKTGRPPSFYVKNPTFSEYEDAMRNFSYVEAEMPVPASGEERLVWMCNPNNPTGEITPQEEIAAVASHDGVLLTIDQSYEHYTKAKLLTAADAVKMGNVILVHSMTKNYAIPGLRIGYIVAAPELIQRVSQCQHPWSVNALAIEASLFLLKEHDNLIPALDDYLHETELLRTALNRIEGISVVPTQTNFMLCTMDKGTAAQLKTYLAEKHHILIRDASNFTGLSERHFRVATQLPEENRALVAAVKEYMADV